MNGAGKKASRDSAALIDRIRSVLSSLPENPPTSRNEIRDEVRRLADMTRDFRSLTKLRLTGLTEAKAARNRILAYLKLFVGEIIDGKELQVVGGIQECARRIRELRVQFGYKISTGYSRDELRPNQYVLESRDPDPEEAEKWQTVNRIRRQTGSGQNRILALLRAYVGKPVTGDQIAYVAQIRSAERRARQLRTEFGWRVVTSFTGNPDLPPNSYMLTSDDQLPVHDRKIPDDTYNGVLEGDKYACRACGWTIAKRNPADRRQFLEVHHIEFHHEGGTNNSDNLITLCNVHHDAVHRKKASGKKFFEWLKKQRKPGA